MQAHELGRVFQSRTGEPTIALTNVSLSVEPGEFVALIGPSGCGKTSLINIVAGLDEQTSGSVTVDGQVPRPGNHNIGYLFARDCLLPWKNVLGNAELAMRLVGVPKHERRKRAIWMLEEVGLGKFVDSFRSELSQGMRQRVALARTLSTEPSLLLMDEPFSALDAQTRLVVQDVFMRLVSRTGVTVVLITHDLSEAIALSDRVIVMSRSPGRIKAEFEIDLEHPRSVASLQGDHKFHQYYETIWAQLRDEFQNLDIESEAAAPL